MKGKLFLAAVAALGATWAVLAADAKAKKATKGREADPAFLEETGGYIVREDKGNGSVLLANAQTRVAAEKIGHPVRYMHVYAKMPISMRTVPAADVARPDAGTARRLGATLVVVIRDDPSATSPILLSPDEHWAVVNVAALDADKPGDETLAARASKCINRAICHLCGGGGSQYANTMVGPFKDPVKDYDRFPTDGVPPDVFPRMQNYLGTLGVRPYVRTTYENACRKGWAPAPTNKYQKAVWDRVHKAPTAPIVIRPETKKQK